MATKNAGKDQDFESPIADTLLGTLAALVLATEAADTGFLNLPQDIAEQFEKAGFADLWKDGETTMVDGDGNVKSRATTQGIEYSKSHPAVPTSDYEAGGVPNATKRSNSGFVRPSNIEIDTNVPMPTARRGRGEGAAYPFDKLEVGQSFHIAATEAAPEPAKSVASSVSAANLKYSEEIEGKTRKARVKNKETGQFETKDVPARKQLRRFFAQSVGADDPKGAGVRVWRDKVEEGEEAEDDAED